VLGLRDEISLPCRLWINWDGKGACIAVLASGLLVLRWVVSSSCSIAGVTFLVKTCKKYLQKQLKQETTILYKVRLQQLKRMGHIHRMKKSRLPKVNFEGRIHRRLLPGIPRNRWKDNFGGDLLCLLKKADDHASYRKLINERVKGIAPTRPLRTSRTQVSKISPERKSFYVPFVDQITLLSMQW